MSNLIIQCPHCDRPTPVELGKRVSSKQRCKHCKQLIGESDLVIGGRKPVTRKKVTVAGQQFGGERNLEDERPELAEVDATTGRPRRRFLMSHVIVTLLVVCLGLAGVGYVLYKNYINRKVEHQLNMERFSEIKAQIQENEAEDFGPRSIGSMPEPEFVTACRDKFLELSECETAEELLQYVRKPDKVEQRLVDYYEEGRGELPVKNWLEMKDDAEVQYDDSLEIAVIYLYKADGELWWVVMGQTPEGPKLDWESFVRYCEQDVHEFLEQKTQEEKEFRVLAMIDDYFNYRYDNPYEYVCVRLFDPTESFIFYGYVEKKSPLGKTIWSQVPAKRIKIDNLSTTESWRATELRGINPARTDAPGLRKPRALVTIKAKFPDPLEGDNQVEITDFIRRSWYVP